MRNVIALVVVLLSLLSIASTISAANRTRRFRVPNILRGTADAMGVPIGTQKLTSETLRTVAGAIAALDVNKSKQSRRFYQLCDKLVKEVDAGGIPPGYLWRRFLKGRHVSGANMPEQMTPKARNGERIIFSLGDYDALLNWMKPYLAKASRDDHRAESRNGEALITLEMEDLFAHFYITGIASYSEHLLTSRARRGYLARTPEAYVIAQNAALRRLFRNYYRDTMRLDYWSMTPTLKEFQLMINQKRLSAAGVRHVLAGLTQLRTLVGSEQYFNQWELCYVAWRFLNFAHARKDAKAAAEIRAYIESWKQHTHRQNVMRWLSEALKVRGSAPEHIWSPPIKIKLRQ